ncbi:hypothetical protein XENOCAPTIV_020002 [Xenoophorus captivus]|uniref:Uncharacterized protein n=1 Tax=Xenoophorus captivus TaxID=1517983 RepID=A0ABV0RI68_9TELE
MEQLWVKLSAPHDSIACRTFSSKKMKLFSVLVSHISVEEFCSSLHFNFASGYCGLQVVFCTLSTKEGFLVIHCSRVRLFISGKHLQQLPILPGPRLDCNAQIKGAPSHCAVHC